jgi:hypothetical protein
VIFFLSFFLSGRDAALCRQSQLKTSCCCPPLDSAFVDFERLNGKSRFITDATVNLFLIIGEKRCGQAFVGVSVGDKKVFFSPLKESSEKF